MSEDKTSINYPTLKVGTKLEGEQKGSFTDAMIIGGDEAEGIGDSMPSVPDSNPTLAIGGEDANKIRDAIRQAEERKGSQ